jgi:hypothetical protein
MDVKSLQTSEKHRFAIYSYSTSHKVENIQVCLNSMQKPDVKYTGTH